MLNVLVRAGYPKFPPRRRKLIYCDVGARGGLGHPWDRLRAEISTVGFEPDLEEYARLSKKLPLGDVCLPHVLFSTPGELNLYLTKSRGCSSVYLPNKSFLCQFPDSERFAVEKILQIHAVTLDDLYRDRSIADIDFIKIDVQGAELDILKGGRKLVDDKVIGVELEVEFAQMYVDQPLFRDVDRHMAECGFQLQDLRRNYWKLKGASQIGALKGQLIFGDALYFRSVEGIVALCGRSSRDQAIEKIESCLLMSVAYGYLDYAMQLLVNQQIVEILGESAVSEWTDCLKKFDRSLRFWKAGRGHVAFVLQSLYRLFQASHGGWATSDTQLGSAKRFGWFQ